MIQHLALDALQRHLAGSPLYGWATSLPAQIAARIEEGHGDLARWWSAVQRLPQVPAPKVELAQRFALHSDHDAALQAQVKEALQGLIPWRKGPFDFFGVQVDTEWRSDWKWERVSPHVELRGKRVLDVGCGNGYYQWRMLGAGAESVVGVDPNWLFLCQFLAAKRYLPELPAWHLPLALEDLPEKLEGFDTVFSMGVLYHRRSPIDHLLAAAANWSWRPWWWKATPAPCWCPRTATRRCATSGSCPRWQPWSSGCAAPGSPTRAASTSA